MELKAKQQPFSDQQQAWYAKACKLIDAERLRRSILELTSIHSPTGKEAAASKYMVRYMNNAGIPASYQPVNELSGNCIGRLRGSGEGPTILLYAPVDTHLEAEPEVDIPWVGPSLRDDMKPDAYLNQDGQVIGLGASNPKSMVCTITEAARCVAEAGVELTGDVVVATAGGGMPWYVPERNNFGCSTGVSYLLSHGVSADFGIIFKPWDEVYYEHPGMCWFKVTTWGTMGYAGIPRGVPGFESSIVPGAKVILELEDWLAGYPDHHSSAQIRPEGWIAAVRSGWPEKPAFPSAACEIYLDVRTNPDQRMADVEAEFNQVMRGILGRHPDVKADWEMYLSCQGSRCEPDHWIVHSCLRAWEQRHGKPYPGAAMLSGQTDAATIGNTGLPLVRVGYPWLGDKDMPEEFAEGLGGMGVAHVPDLTGPCESLIYTIIDSCTRSRTDCLG